MNDAKRFVKGIYLIYHTEILSKVIHRRFRLEPKQWGLVFPGFSRPDMTVFFEGAGKILRFLRVPKGFALSLFPNTWNSWQKISHKFPFILVRYVR